MNIALTNDSPADFKNICPKLFLAPMEGVGDSSFRKAMASVGGFDEATREFIRVPINPNIKNLVSQYDPEEMSPYPMTPQLMGAYPDDLALVAQHLVKKGAKKIDLNCGCPSNTVTGKGAGSSLLKDPNHLYKVAKALVDASDVPVTAKLRAGFHDTSLFVENLLAAQESGVKYITLHPRTKAEGYGPPANISLIKQAKEVLSIPVVGNGDILTVNDAVNMLNTTGCDALMIGRGALINPFIFHEIKLYFNQKSYPHPSLNSYLHKFIESMPSQMIAKTKVNKLKQLLSFICKSSEKLLSIRQELLRYRGDDVYELLNLYIGPV